MGITVAELLAEPQLGLSLLAGGTGLAKTISWAHTSDLERLWEWVAGGELMMTNGLSIPADPAGQVRLAEHLAAAGASAVAVGEKMHAPALSDALREACDRLQLPLINIPYPLPFIAIARSVAEASLVEQSHRLRRTARIYDLIRKTSTPGWQLQELADDIGVELSAEIFVVDRQCRHPWNPDARPLPAAPAGEMASITATGTGLRGHTLADGRHILTLDIPTHSTGLLVAVPAPRTQPDTVLLLHAATVLGLGMSQYVLELENRRRMGAEFLAQAVDGHYSAAEAGNRLEDFGVPAQDFVLLAMSADEEQSLDGLHTSLHRHGYACTSFRRFGRLHLAVASQCPDQVLLHCTEPGVRIGVSSAASAPAIAGAVQESLWALGSLADSTTRLRRYGSGPSWLGTSSVAEGRAMVRGILGPLLDYEQGRQRDLLITLRTYLQLQRSWQKTAAAMFSHRQTIIYRIKKVGELLHLDMNETSSLTQVWFALQLHDSLNMADPGTPMRPSSSRAP